jgi:hypothetical protein
MIRALTLPQAAGNALAFMVQEMLLAAGALKNRWAFVGLQEVTWNAE